jgi:hypothetical protein
VNPLTGPPAPSDEPTPGIVGDSTRVPSGEPVPGGAPSPEISTPRPGPADSIARVLPDTSGGRRDTLGVRPGIAAVDTAGRVPPPPRRPRFQFDLGSLIAHIGSIGTDASFTQSSSYSRVTGTPDFFYLLGLKPNPSGYGDGERVSPVAGNTRSASRDLRTGARTRVTLPFGMSLTTRADFQSRANETNGLASRTLTFHYPYIDVEYGTITKIIRLERFLQRPVLKTTLDHNLTHGYAPGSSRKTSITESTELRPLLSLSGELKNQTRVDMRIDTRNTTNENRLLGSSTDFDRTVEGKLDLSRQYTQGQKVQFLGKESTVRSSISLGASAVYSRLSRGTIVNGNQIQPYKESRLSVSGTGSYGFSDNVYGNASIGFSQTRNLVSAIVTRSLRVELRAQFSF